MSEEEAEILKFFCRHLVGLSIAYRHKTANEKNLAPRFSTCSGTLIIIEDVLCFLTAGHVLEELDKLRASEEIDILEALLTDTFGWKCVSEKPIPFDLKNAGLFYIDNPAMGLDFGVIPLAPYYARLLAKNGVVAISEENWIHQNSLSFDKYVMLGFPTELMSERLSPSADATVEPVMLTVHPIPDANDQEPTTYPVFHGKISSDVPLKSIKGMSGGPIIGFCSKPELRYWIVALQSSWRPSTRIVRGCSVPVLASLLTKWARQDTAA